MKIVTVMGSPRINGNTARLIHKLTELLPETDIELIELAKYNLHGCQGCGSCQQDYKNFTCVQKDEANALLEKIMAADAVVYATPLYGHNYSGQLKIFLDRHLPLFKFVEGKEEAVQNMKIISAMENKPVFLIVSCQGPKQDNTELIKELFIRFCQSSLAQCAGVYIFPFCNPQAQKSVYNEQTLAQIAKTIKQYQ